MKTYKTLIVWQKSVDLVEVVYVLTRKFPEDERFNLVSQLRRCAVSIPSNIAEGHGRKSDGEFIHFLKIAFGSSSELETQLLISHRLKMLSKEEYDKVSESLIHIRKMLNKLISTMTDTKNKALRTKS
jgi:four helix bundle protein